MKVRLTALAGALLVCLGLLAPVPPAQAAVPDPATDPFLLAPAGLAGYAAGAVIRQRTVSAKVLGPVPMPGRATQILVRSTDAKGRPAAVSAVVVTPAFGARRQLLAYAPATDSLGATCEPSYTLQEGTEKEAAIVATAVSLGLTVVVVDHQGPRHAYAAGRMAGHAMLDAARGAIALPGSSLAGPGTRVAAVGYSGGAIAAGWTAQLQPSYAPELNLVGVASGGTPADLEEAGRFMDGGLFGGLFVAASIGMSREYPELLSIFNAKGLALVDKVGDLCSTELLARPFESVKKYSDSPDPLREPAAQAVLAINKMGTPGLAPKVPYYLWHSRFDQLIPWSSAAQLRRDWCGQGTRVQFVSNWLSEHVSGAVAMIPTALPWLLARLDGKPFSGNCP